jgi:hypothetical protein
MLNVKFESKLFLNSIRNTILPNDNGDYVPVKTCRDRFQKIDVHSIYSLAFAFSSEMALLEGNIALASIGQYYSIFHLSFALTALDLSRKDEEFVTVSHKILKSKLKDFVDKNIVSKDFLYIFHDLNDTRNYFNYLNVGTGLEKTMMMKQGNSLRSCCFGLVNFRGNT